MIRLAPEPLLVVLAGAGLIHAVIWHAGADWLEAALSWTVIAILAACMWRRKSG